MLAAFPEDHRPGTWVERKDLGRAIRRWARSGGESLNTGADAVAIAQAASEAGGILTVGDMASYEVKVREPVVVPFGEYTVVSMAPPSSGGIVLAQVLQEFLALYQQQKMELE